MERLRLISDKGARPVIQGCKRICMEGQMKLPCYAHRQQTCSVVMRRTGSTWSIFSIRSLASKDISDQYL